MLEHFSQQARVFVVALLFLPFAAATAHAQSDPRAIDAVRAAVNSQLQADRTDRSNWIYIDHDVTPDHDTTAYCVGSPQGEVRLAFEQHGRPVDAATRQAGLDHVAEYVSDPAAQARAHKNQAHDDQQATELLKMLPQAFIWTIESETPEFLTLTYRPNPSFNAPDMEARVMGAMSGQLVIARNGNLIRSLRGTLTQDFKIGYGFLGRLYKGGTFDVERRDVGDGHWEIVQTHVHIGGHVLFFKSIGTQEDDVKTEWRPSPAQNLREAEEQLRNMK